MRLFLILLVSACGSGEEEVVTCEYKGCDQLCVEAGSEDWYCTDTAALWETCYDDGYKVCEAQADNTCGWTVVDQDGWDECVDNGGQ